MFAHSVYHWLKDDVSWNDRAEFEKGLRLLTTIPTVVHGYVGTPAPTTKPVVDGSYQYALLVIFQGLPAFEEFQRHPAYVAFGDLALRCCKKVVVYDCHDR